MSRLYPKCIWDRIQVCNKMKLLNKSFKPFAIFTVIILVCSIPLYYWVIQLIYLSDSDESLVIKKEILQERLHDLSQNEAEALQIIATLNELKIGYTIEKFGGDPETWEDRIYSIERFDTFHGHVEPFRILESLLLVYDQYYFLKVETDLDEFNDVVPYTALLAGLFFMLILSGYYWVNQRISSRIWKPFLNVLEDLGTNSISSEKPLPQIESDIEEFQKLSDILQRYTRKNRTIYLQQKEFIENAAHELQTPIMILKAKSDALLQTTTLSEKQSFILDEINQITGRMNKINNNLLLLAKLENRQFEAKVKFLLNEIIDDTIEYYKELALNKKLKFTFLSAHTVGLEANKGLTEILMNNLFRNAITYNTSPGEIVLKLGTNSFSISNSSTIPELDNKLIFKRFYKTGTSKNSMGLGLAICWEICQSQGWVLSYHFANGIHTFTLDF
jgi:signal transduction histidine kinase